jgi:hypothetical protein
VLDDDLQEMAEAVAKLGDHRAAEPLVAHFREGLRNKYDTSVLAREAVARALGVVGDLEAVPPLVESLEEHGENDLREIAATALREILRRTGTGGLSAAVALTTVAGLLARLTDFREVSRPCAEALQALGWQPKTATQRALRAVALGKYAEAEREGVAAIWPLLEARDSGNGRLEPAGVACLQRLGGNPDATILAFLRSVEGTERYRLRRALENCRGNSWHPELHPLASRLLGLCAQVDPPR